MMAILRNTEYKDHTKNTRTTQKTLYLYTYVYSFNEKNILTRHKTIYKVVQNRMIADQIMSLNKVLYYVYLHLFISEFIWHA